MRPIDRAANLKEALGLIRAAPDPEVATLAETSVREIEAAMESVGWAEVPPQVEPLVRRLCDLFASWVPPIPNPCGRFMCSPCQIDLLIDPEEYVGR